jgi:hypothetical protein
LYIVLLYIPFLFIIVIILVCTPPPPPFIAFVILTDPRVPGEEERGGTQ